MGLFRKKTINGIPIEKIKQETIDMASIFSSIADREEISSLYKKLSRISHPDNYVGNDSKQRKATELFQAVQESQTSLSRLQELDLMITKELL